MSFDRLIATPTVAQGRIWCNLLPVSLTKLHTKCSIKLELLNLQKPCRHEIDRKLSADFRSSSGSGYRSEQHSQALHAFLQQSRQLAICHSIFTKSAVETTSPLSATATNAAPISLDRGLRVAKVGLWSLQCRRWRRTQISMYFPGIGGCEKIVCFGSSPKLPSFRAEVLPLSSSRVCF